MARRSLAVAGFCALLALSASACGGDGGPLTLEEYFNEMEDISDRADEESAAIEEKYADVADFEEFSPALRDDYQAFFEESVDFLDEVIDEIEQLNPPAEAEDAHNEFVEAYRGLTAEFDEVVQDIDTFDSEEDFTEAFLGGGFVDAVTDAEAACNTLQALAEDNDITVNLDCDS